MNRNYRLLFITPAAWLAAIIFFLHPFCAVAQQKDSLENTLRGADGEKLDLQVEDNVIVPLTIDLEEEEEESDDKKDKKKKKRKKKVFYGIKTKKGFTKNGYGDKVVFELFYYLKQFEQPDPYLQHVYWFDKRRKQIRSSPNVNKKYSLILHGPYKKITQDGQVLQKGIYYKGARHGRWESYNRKDILQDKRKYTRGWPRNAKITYYDENTRKKIKEVIPVVYGEKKGEYLYFHESGNIAVKGQYDNDVPVGLWTEFYDFRGMTKKQIQYREDPWNKDFLPFIYKEWNAEGQLIYKNEDLRRAQLNQ